MRLVNNHGSVREGDSISYEHFIYYLEQGREIEFSYLDELYFIDNAKKGRALWLGQTLLSGYCVGDCIFWLDSLKINGERLADLLKSQEIKISTIF
ncbi:hypothetical protein [Sutcliffiella horikoshii]|uniref:hypothetical protein n=1 Tax=Sutcliffiella horikoshii TaxID=79883 RepID=UPI003CF6442C